MNLYSYLHVLPSVARFASNVVEDLGNNRNCLLIIPLGTDEYEIWPFIRGDLLEKDFHLLELDVDDKQKGESWPLFLARSLGLAEFVDRDPSISELVSSDLLPELIYLNGFSMVNGEDFLSGLRFIQNWSHASHSQTNIGGYPTAFIFMVRGGCHPEDLPDADLLLARHWWWGFPSVLELRLICRLASEDNIDGVAQWREFVLPSIAGPDLRLLCELWDDIGDGLDDLLDRLRLIAHKRGWHAEFFKELGGKDCFKLNSVGRVCSKNEPPPGLRDLWSAGLVHWTPEYGLDFHCVALAALGLDSEVSHRLWRGQAELLLPIIDRTRLDICNMMTRLYSPNWPTRWKPPLELRQHEAVLSNPLSCGWGHLKMLFNNVTDLKMQYGLQELVTVAHQIRNTLAHYNPILLKEYQDLHSRLFT